MPQSLYTTIKKLPIEIKLVGSWTEATKLPSYVQSAINAGYQQAVKYYTNRFATVIKKAIRTGNPPPGSGVWWPPLSEATQRRYHKGPEAHFMITGIYSRSITITHTKKYSYVRIRKGRASGGSTDRRSGLSIAEVARVLEFGTGDGARTSIPARPLWRATLISLGGKPFIKSTVIKYIRKALYSMGIKANQVRYA